MTPEDFMCEALAQAKAAARAGEVPVGAVAEVGGVIVAAARNRVEENKDATCHAELLLLRELARLRGDWRFDDVTVYVTKEPCAMCAGAMVNAHVKKVVFALRDPRSGCCGSALDVTGFPGMLWRVPAEGGLLEAEALAVMRAFFRSVRARKTPPATCGMFSVQVRRLLHF